jgi:hypothetical protein
MGGHVDWNEWSFDWDLVEYEGLNLSHVRFDGKEVFGKASMPAIRVWYEDGSGPYLDQMGERCPGFLKITSCNDKKVCLTSFDDDGTKWADIRCGCHIGAYRLFQAWQFSRDGRIRPRLASRGVHSPSVHVHHVYWRLDFDIDGPGDNEVWVHDDNDEWHRYTVETAVRKRSGRTWLVRNRSTHRGVWITPGPNDGHADDFFCRADLAVRRYRSQEDEPWPFGACGGLGYDEDEGVVGTDVVVWYVAHLFHDATHEKEGSLGEWHECGPEMEFADQSIRWLSVRHFMEAKGWDPALGVRPHTSGAGDKSVKHVLAA